MKPTLLRRAILAALTGGTAATAAPVALAQDQEAADTLETITVVGSRIKRTDIETSQPVFVLEREDIARTGLTSVGDVLQELSNNGAALNTTFNNGGNGQTSVSLRNCGQNRTLVLVNGKRWVSTLAGSVDLNTIPVSVVERIEVLKDGASSIYGTDAICGVINLTTRDNYDGAEANVYYGEWDDGDGQTQAYDFTLGSSTDRASTAVNVSYVTNEAVRAGDREISAIPLQGFPANTSFPGQASAATPFGQFFLPSGPSQTLIPGRPGTAASDFKPYNFATDGYNFAPDNYLLTPQERTSVYAQARYNLTDAITFRSDLLFTERKSSQELAPSPLTLGAGGGIGGQTRVSAQNIYNPFGVDIPIVQYRPALQKRNFAQDVDTFRFSGGFDGAFDLFERSFSWDAAYSYTDSERRDITLGLFNMNNLRTAVGPSFRDSAGVARCGTPTAVIAGCVPVNLFGGPEGFNQAMLDSTTFTAQDYRYKKHYNYTANVTGDLFELPAGPVGFAAGYEYRREFGFDQPDALISSGASSGNARQPTRGGFALDEFYVEFNVPLLTDAPFAETLEFSIATRYSDYTNFGDTTNPKFGFRWKPIDDLLVRGNYADGFRAPTVSELFLGNSDSFPNIADPCSANNNPTGAVLARCQQGFGGVGPVPAGYNQLNAQIRITIGGNPNLQPETATTKTLGLVYSPSWVEGLDLYLDWYNIAIEDQIAGPTGGFLVTDCYITPNPVSCAQITRGATGEITNIFAGLSNTVGGLEVEGYDFTVDYRFDTDWGKFRVNWDNAYISYYGNVGQAAGNNTVGLLFGAARIPIWRLRSNITLTWQQGDWGASLTGRYFSPLDEDCTAAEATALGLTARGINTPIPCSRPQGSPQWPVAENRVEDVWYFDLRGTWDAPWNARVTAGVRNVFDQEPPVAYSAFANSFDPQYDIPGRFWYVQYTQRF
jgi:iron complex outermembrane receptor protein